MKPITGQLLAKLYDAPLDRVTPFVDPLKATVAKYGISSSINELAAFLATIGVESGGLRLLVENLNYSAQGLANTWPGRYAVDRWAKPKVPNALAHRLARKPEAIANNCYANRMGNRDEASGDGWRHRGAGLIQQTGKETQSRYAAAVGQTIESVGAWLRTPSGAADSAGWFWKDKKVGIPAAKGDMDIVTLIVNGGKTGLAERRALFSRAKELLA